MEVNKILMIYPVCQALRERAFPLGFFIASSVLNNNGFKVRCIELWSENDWKEKLQENLVDFEPEAIGFSVCGATNYKFALEIIKKLDLHQRYKIFMGGQHVQPPTLMKSEFYEGYTGYIENRGEIFGKKLDLNTKLAEVDFNLVANPMDYIPAVEISRGCWNSCQFCNAGSLHVEKPVSQIERELQVIADIYPKGTVLTLGGSNQVFRKWDKRGLLSLLKDYSSYFRYNFNCGVESGWESVWDDILSMDIWNLFVGIEAVSESTLISMKKTKNPQVYVKKASDLLHRCASDGVYAFVTYIYGYPFSGFSELESLDNFILGHSNKYIVQLGAPIQAYPGTRLLLERKFYEDLGIKYNNAFRSEEEPLVEYYHLDVSEELNFSYLEQRASDIFVKVNQYKDSYYRCCGFRNFSTFELFEKNIHYYSSFYREL